MTAISPSAGILLFYDEDQQGALSNAHVGVIGACPRPHRLTRVETLLNGHPIDDGVDPTGETAAEEVDPSDDLHADAATVRGSWGRSSSAVSGPRLSKAARDAGGPPSSWI